MQHIGHLELISHGGDLLDSFSEWIHSALWGHETWFACHCNTILQLHAILTPNHGKCVIVHSVFSSSLLWFFIPNLFLFFKKNQVSAASATMDYACHEEHSYFEHKNHVFFPYCIQWTNHVLFLCGSLSRVRFASMLHFYWL